MRHTISAKEDTSSGLYRGRAAASEIADIPQMDSTGWKERLAAGIEAKGLSQREVSLRSGNGPGYVNSLIKEGKDPTVHNLIKVCEAAGLSFTHVLFGASLDREAEEIVLAVQQASPRRRESLLALLERDTDEAPMQID